MEFMLSIAASFAINIITNLISEKKLQKDEKDKKGKIRTTISDFNRKYDNTVLDSYFFQQFIESQNITEKIYGYIFGQNNNKVLVQDFKKAIGQEAIAFVQNFYDERGWDKLKDINVFYEYFSDLIDTLVKIRSEILSLEHSAQTAILTEKITSATEQVIGEISRQKEDNIFAEDKIKQILDLISLYKFVEAEQIISEVLESQQFLSNSQRELVYFQKARILINRRKIDSVETIITKINRINSESRYITEINYYIACNKNDLVLLENTIKQFEINRYSSEKILLKRASYEAILGHFEKMLEMISHNDELEDILQNYDEAHYLYGMALNSIGNFERGYKEFSLAFDMSPNIIYKYNSLLAKYRILNENKEKIIERIEDYLVEVNDTINEFRNLEYITEFFEEEQLVYYWIFRIDLILIYDLKQALVEVDKINKKIEENKLIKGLKAHVFLANNLYSEAKELLNDVWNLNIINAVSYFFILAEEKDWETIKTKYNELEGTDFTNNPEILSVYIKAKNEIDGYQSIRDQIDNLFRINFASFLFLKTSLTIVLENSDEDLFASMFEFILSNKKYLYNKQLFSICLLLNKYFKTIEIRELIEDRIEDNEDLMTLYFSTINLEKKHLNLTKDIYNKIKAIYENGCKFKTLLSFKVRIEIDLELYKKAQKTLLEYKAIYGLDETYSYYSIICSIQIDEVQGLEDEINVLLITNNPHYHQAVAALKAKQGFWEEAQNIELKAFYKSYDNLDQQILMNYISFYFSNNEKIIEQVNPTEVTLNSVVSLRTVENNKTRKIALHKNSALIDKPGEYKFDCENYGADHPTSLILISLGKKGENITFDNCDYIVEDILNLNAYFTRLCLEKLEKDFPNHGHFILMSDKSTDGLIKKMKEQLKKTSESQKQLLNSYNFAFNIGLPISMLSGKNIDKYCEIIISLLSLHNQHFYVGEVSLFEDKEYILSISSIILLSTYNMLDRVDKIKEKCIVETEVKKSILEGMRESKKHADSVFGTLSLDENGELTRYVYNDEAKKNRKLFWTEIQSIIGKLKDESIEIEYNEMYDVASNMLLDEDIASIELSKKTNKVLVCDDLFIRKLHKGITGIDNTTNFIGLLVSEELITLDECIELILKLAKNKYLYSVSGISLATLFHWVLTIEDHEIRKVYFEKLKEIVNNIFDDASKQFYESIYNEFVLASLNFGIPFGQIYELVREPLGLTPFDEFFKEKSQEIIKKMLQTDNNDSDIQPEEEE